MSSREASEPKNRAFLLLRDGIYQRISTLISTVRAPSPSMARTHYEKKRHTSGRLFVFLACCKGGSSILYRVRGCVVVVTNDGDDASSLRPEAACFSERANQGRIWA